ncbi:MAG: LysR family transcriptional regulator, partial [Granulosicoccaceae bacterium]
MSDHPPLHWLRSFVFSAKALSFTRAANELALTQAAVSKHIKGLEAWLGVQLFIREAHGLALTE